ncbi:MAG TPA: alpha/beta fold hydrolase [Solirubrobacteraceae bacterium]|nr:alpha/beta fold hydrolase [Solirubrobacteraceae bacterium]
MDGYGPTGRSRWLDVDWGAHRRFVEIEGRRVNVVELGSGPPLVFVHGLGGSWTNWLENLCEFARDHRVIAFDLPGFGASESPDGPVSIAGYARVLAGLFEALGVGRAAVVGNSLGGLVCAEFALTSAPRVDRLCLVAAAGLSISRLPIEPALRALVPLERVVAFYGTLIAERSVPLARRARLRRLLLFHAFAHPERLPAPLAAEVIAGAGRPSLLPGLRAMTGYPNRDRLGEIGCPTLVVWGASDRLVPLRDADEFERRIPGARKVVYADTGHVPEIERPACFNEDLRAFLAESPARAPSR